MTTLKVSVQKGIELQQSEELQDFIQKVMKAVGRFRMETNKSLFLTGIFNDHIIVRDWEDSSFFKMSLTREESGDIIVGDLQKVRQVFVPVDEAVQKGEKSSGLALLHKGESLDLPIERSALLAVLKTVDSEFETHEVQEVRKSAWDNVLGW